MCLGVEKVTAEGHFVDNEYGLLGLGPSLCRERGVTP